MRTAIWFVAAALVEINLTLGHEYHISSTVAMVAVLILFIIADVYELFVK